MFSSDFSEFFRPGILKFVGGMPVICKDLWDTVIFFGRVSVSSVSYFKSLKIQNILTNTLSFFKGTLMQIWKSTYIFKFI